MLLKPGRGLSPIAKGPDYKAFHLTSSLPSVFTYTRSDTVATYRNSGGILQIATGNGPRFNHDIAGNKLGLLMEGSRQNKITLYNAVPTATTGISVTGTAAVSLVTDGGALSSAGLASVCAGNVFQASGGGSGGSILLPGTVGNINKHSFSVWARVTAGTSASLKHSGASSGTTTIGGGAYVRYKLENQTPNASGNQLMLTLPASTTILFILPQIEEATFASSEIITSGSAATRQRDNLVISNLNTQSFWNISQGYILARYRPQTQAGADQYPICAHDGSSNNTIGFRVDGTNYDHRANIRAAGAGKFTAANGTKHADSVLTAAAVTWKSGASAMIGNGDPVSGTYTGDPAGITTFQVGARNGGNDPLWGHIPYIEIGRSYLAIGQLSARLKQIGDSVTLAGGQSLIGGLFSSQASSSAGGYQNFLQTLQSIRLTDAAVFANGATGSSAACKTSNASNYWWDLATSTRGPALESFYDVYEAANFRPGFIYWAQGEEDSHHIPASTTRQNYKDALIAIFGDMRAVLGDIPVIIQRIGRRTGTYTNAGGVQVVREVQQELIDTYDWLHDGPEIYDCGLSDNVHLDDAGYVTVGRRDARKLASVAGASLAGADGPRITGVSRSGTTVTVTLAHDGGTDFTPSSGIEGFRFFDNASEITINAAVRTNATTITLTLATTPTQTPKTLYYGYDAMIGINVSNVVKDNKSQPMPLRTGKVTVS